MPPALFCLWLFTYPFYPPRIGKERAGTAKKEWKKIVLLSVKNPNGHLPRLLAKYYLVCGVGQSGKF